MYQDECLCIDISSIEMTGDVYTFRTFMSKPGIPVIWEEADMAVG